MTRKSVLLEICLKCPSKIKNFLLLMSGRKGVSGVLKADWFGHQLFEDLVFLARMISDARFLSDCDCCFCSVSVWGVQGEDAHENFVMGAISFSWCNGLVTVRYIHSFLQACI